MRIFVVIYTFELVSHKERFKFKGNVVDNSNKPETVCEL